MIHTKWNEKRSKSKQNQMYAQSKRNNKEQNKRNWANKPIKYKMNKAVKKTNTVMVNMSANENHIIFSFECVQPMHEYVHNT